MGSIKKMQFEHFSGLLEYPKICVSSAENPGVILTFLSGIGYFYSNGLFCLFIYMYVYIYNKGNSLTTVASISCYRNA